MPVLNFNKLFPGFKLRLILILCFEFSYSLYAQHFLYHPELKIDTNYTISGTYQKLIKNYPFISIATYNPVNKITINKDFEYCQYGTRKMHLDIYIPVKQTQKSKACVILIHGGGWNSGDKDMCQPFALALADNDFIAIPVEYRFSDEAKYPASVFDLKSALVWIYQNSLKFGIDTTKISIMGFSAGGQLASLVGLTSQKEIFINENYPAEIKPKINAVINMDGILAFLNPLSEEGRNTKGQGAAEKWFGVHFSTDSSKWMEASPLLYADEKSPPFLFVASSFPRFNAGRDEMIRIFEKSGIYYEKYILEGAPHSFWFFNPWFQTCLNYSINFLLKN
ncbi:MAG: alpha/beta hydrolase [Bacteroidales bacterium]